MDKREIVKGFLFTICIDIVRKTVNFFETYRKVISNVYGEKDLNIIHERYGESISCGAYLDESDGEYFRYFWDDAVD